MDRTTKKIKKDYFYEDFGEGKVIYEIPKVLNAYEWEEKQIIPCLQAYNILSCDNEMSDWFKKGSKELNLIRIILDNYGSIKFGNELEMGIIKLTKEEFNNMIEF